MKVKQTFKTVLIITFLTIFFLLSKAQQVNTLYFMENIPVRNSLNPAFQPLSDFYFGLPILGHTMFGMSNNSLRLSDIIYKDTNGNPISFLHPNGNKNLFLNTLKKNWTFGADLQINLLDVGFRKGSSYWSLTVNEKVGNQTVIPSDVFRFALLGTPNINDNLFKINSLTLNTTIFTEIGLGYSRKINEKFSLGGKLKLLLGNANVSYAAEELFLNANVDQWELKGNGTMLYSSPIALNGNTTDSINAVMPQSVTDFIKPSGMGVGVDVGFTFSPAENIHLSASINDLGFIGWHKNLKRFDSNIDFIYSGNDTLNLNSDRNISNYVTKLIDDIENSYEDSLISVSEPYKTYLFPKINLGAEYCFYDNKLSLGLLMRSIFVSKQIKPELTVSINGRPVNWFNMSLSSSFFNGKVISLGAGIGLRTGPLNWFLSSDYIPFNFIPLPLNKIDSSFPTFSAFIPNKTQGVNLALGVNIVLGNKKDADKDGVKDSKDLCPDTPKGVKVDKNGCPIDTDGDGVADDKDLCPDTPAAVNKKVDENGCPLDSDKDSVPDYLDKCPDTVENERAYVDTTGCVVDTDLDGVADFKDKCINTPKDVKVDSIGCPLDTDNDGVPDYLDKCPEIKGSKKNNGCEEVVVKPLVKPTAEPSDNEVVNQNMKKLFQKALQGISFEQGSDRIKQNSHDILNQIAGVLKSNPTYLIEIRGFTDSQGNDELNLILSEKRARAVLNYLAAKGIDLGRMKSKGYGEIFPIADNSTPQGRSKNRRVEFIVSYNEITIE